jgi:hypothetical protein
VEICDAEGDQLIKRWIIKLKNDGLSEKLIKRKLKRKWKLAAPLLSDRAAALEGICFSLGSLLGPLIGGKLTDALGY